MTSTALRMRFVERLVGDPLPSRRVYQLTQHDYKSVYGDLDRFADADVKDVVESGNTCC
jgi:hypothetical protein